MEGNCEYTEQAVAGSHQGMALLVLRKSAFFILYIENKIHLLVLLCTNDVQSFVSDAAESDLSPEDHKTTDLQNNFQRFQLEHDVLKRARSLICFVLRMFQGHVCSFLPRNQSVMTPCPRKCLQA
jgi:hypothetical protein